MHRRSLLKTSAAACVASAASRLRAADAQAAEDPAAFELRYLLASCMYGYADLAAILPEAAKVGAAAIDLWPKVHGSQREQLDTIGEAAFAEMLERHELKLGCITQYKLGPFGLQDEMQLAQRLGCRTIVTGGEGPKGLTGAELKRAVADFVEQLKPHLAVAQECGVTLAIENHGNNLIESPDSLRYLAELRPSKHLAVALAPYHLPQNEELLAGLIRELGDAIEVFYAWQHGKGCMSAMPKEDELLQMPGRGSLRFAPLLAALKDIGYRGWTEVFMHPFPRGIPILDSTDAVTREIARGRDHLDSLLPGV